LAPKCTARAIATVWRSPPDKRADRLIRAAQIDAHLAHLFHGDAVGVVMVEELERSESASRARCP
jgi:hypothetical protein